MKKVFIKYSIVILFSSFLFIGCGLLFPQNSKKISVSFAESEAIQKEINVDSFSYKDIKEFDLYPITDETYYKDSVKQRGSLCGEFSVDQFIMEIDTIGIYKMSSNNDYQWESILSTIKQPSGYIIPQHFNIMYAKDIIREADISFSSADGLFIDFLPFLSHSNDGFYLMSMVGVDLGADYNDVILPNEIQNLPQGFPDSSLHYFSFSSLQPFKTGFLGTIVSGGDISEAGIQNPEGIFGVWDTIDGETTGNSSHVFLPGDAIGLSSIENAELTFAWDMTDLIQVYDNKTFSEKTDDVVTFNLSNPFPVSLIVREHINISPSEPGDTIPPGDVFSPAISGSNTYNTLQWINPTAYDFAYVSITRKAGSQPVDHTDGEVVYKGYKTCYYDSTGNSGTHYYYRICVQ